VIGPGGWSLDDALDIREDLIGVTGLLITLIAGAGGAAALLAAFWRPPPRKK
jgi:putative oxidoreductase